MIFHRFTPRGATLPRMIVLLGIIYCTTIYLLQKQKLNHRNYYKQKINMIYFIQAKGYDTNMHANILCMNMHGFL
jgi:hypothetical protein